MTAAQKTSPALVTPDPEIRPKAVRTQWSARERLRILEAADACPPGEIGALLCREGIYSSHLSRWRRQRAQGELAGLAPKRRAEPSPTTRAQAAELARLTRENLRLQAKLAQAEVIIDVPRKACNAVGDHSAGSAERRAGMIAAVAELAPQVGIAAACRLLAVPRSSYYRTCQPVPEPTPRPRSPRALRDAVTTAGAGGRLD